MEKAQDAGIQNELGALEDELNLNLVSGQLDDYFSTPESRAESVVTNLMNQGRNIVSPGNGGSSAQSITGFTLENDSISLSPSGEGVIKVNYTYSQNSGTGDATYYAVVKGHYYKINFINNGFKIERTATDIDVGDGGNAQELNISASVKEGNTVTPGNITNSTNGKEIAITAEATTGITVITVTDGTNSIDCTVNVSIKPAKNTEPTANTNFSTAYGKIDVIFLSGTTNTPTQTPNEPIRTAKNNNNEDETMTKVSWTDNNGTWSMDESEPASNSAWYNYANNKWANAKTQNGSYFVWIPRFAYRITYYSSSSSTTPTGYYDGLGMWDATTGNVRQKLDPGIETTPYNGEEYIVHPAFMADTGKKDSNNNALPDYDRGGWSSNLTGFWFAKFEMAGSSASALNSTYGSASQRSQKIGLQYNSAISATYGYTGKTNDGITSFMNSHMVKNSEWGAVAYLTHSQYGRNGTEVTITNDGTNYRRGGGANEAYLTNVNLSTTGNPYGIYDMSGNAWEYVAAFNSKDDSNYVSSNGWGITKDSSSTKFATKYYNELSGKYNTNAVVYGYGKVGDATKEVNTGGATAITNNSSSYNNWFSDYPYLAGSGNPFFRRGGYYNSGDGAGVFSSAFSNGSSYSDLSFRAALCP